MLLYPAVAACSLFALITATPFRPPLNSTSLKLEKRSIQGVREAYRGIHWDDAAKDCSPEEFDILVESTRVALEVTNFWQGGAIWESSAWNRYFVKSWSVSPRYDWHSSEERQTAFLNIRNNIKQVGLFPRLGKKNFNGDYTRFKQTSYRCTEVPGSNRCAKEPKNGIWRGPSAYTATPALNHQEGWAVVFCPRFFKDGRARYINRITDGGRREPREIGSLISYEYIVIHEWMHNRIFGSRIDIDDVVGLVPGHQNGQAIYGDRLCHEWAWRDARSRPPSINVLTAYNADNYAWYFTYNWFRYKWNWRGDDGSHSYRKRLIKLEEEPAPLEDGVHPINEKDIDLKQNTVPINCEPNPGGIAMADCDYVGEEYKEFVENIDKPFKARKSDCTLSAKCHRSFGYAIDPACSCTCDGHDTPLSDPKCEGFAGALPHPPKNRPPQGGPISS